jgi:hypothetical protein
LEEERRLNAIKEHQELQRALELEQKLEEEAERLIRE